MFKRSGVFGSPPNDDNYSIPFLLENCIRSDFCFKWSLADSGETRNCCHTLFYEKQLSEQSVWDKLKMKLPSRESPLCQLRRVSNSSSSWSLPYLELQKYRLLIFKRIWENFGGLKVLKSLKIVIWKQCLSQT